MTGRLVNSKLVHKIFLGPTKSVVHVMQMLTLNEKEQALELLKMVSWDDLLSLNRTVTEGIVVPINPDDACTAILQHTNNAEELLSRQKITKEVLFTYLHHKKVSCSQKDKLHLKQFVIDLWRGKNSSPNNLPCQLIRTGTSSSFTDEASYENNENLNLVSTRKFDEANELANKFTEWFYSLFNQSTAEIEGCLIGPEHFFSDCSIRMKLISPTSSIENEVNNDAAGVVRLLINTKLEHNLYFNPNLTSEGVYGKMDSHGLVVVAVCGTLHNGQKCAGVFEQLFGLARDPFSSNNWKVKYTELNLKSQELVTELPALRDSDFGRTLLALPESTSAEI